MKDECGKKGGEEDGEKGGGVSARGELPMTRVTCKMIWRSAKMDAL